MTATEPKEQQTPPWLEHFVAYVPALAEKLDGTVTIEDLAAGIARGNYQLWTGNNCVAVTQLFKHPQLKECQVLVTSGDDTANLERLLSHVEKWARMEGCSRIRSNGAVSGWKPVTVSTKEL